MAVKEQYATDTPGTGKERGKKLARTYSLGEEIANAITHGVGVALSIAALVLLIVTAARTGNPWQLASAITYGITLILLYVASTLYHSIPGPRARRVFKIIDHSAIYLLIAGTYTPFMLVTLRDTGGWWWFGVIWGLAVAGVSLEAFWVYRPKWLSAAVYLGMGWLVVTAMNPLLANLPSGGVWLLAAGGLSYTLGTVFYVLKRVPYMHMVWHLFVLGGSVCHFLAVVLYVLK
ncbi:MAG: hemolysin III family protein [Coriobacteriia bacterium]|nr:hemolysin III family protein [Coriobacteriia bacterium]